jgi:hypothetical protein
LDIKQDSLKFSNFESKPELQFTWNSNEIHPKDVQQTIKLFDKCNIILTKSDSDKEPLKYNVRVSSLLSIFNMVLSKFTIVRSF